MIRHNSDLERMDHAWDRMSTDYSAHTELAPTDPHYRALAEQFPETSSPLKIMDLGSGLGFALDAILPKVPNGIVTCLDISSKMLKGLMQRLSAYQDQIVLRNESYVDADLGVGAYDIIISSFTMHHLLEPSKLHVFKNIHAALKDEGQYLELDGVASPAIELSAKREYEQFVAQKEGGDRGEWNFDLLLTIANEKALMGQAGFSSVHVPWTDTDDEGWGRAIFVAKK